VITDNAKMDGISRSLKGHPVMKIHAGFPYSHSPLDLFHLKGRMAQIFCQQADLLVSFLLDMEGEFPVKPSERLVGVYFH